MVHHASRLTRAAITTTVVMLGIAGTAIATPAFASAPAHSTHQLTCLNGGGYTRLKMAPAPITVFGSLQASQSATFSVQAQNGTTCVAGTVVYVDVSSHVNGDVLAPQTPSECGNTTSIGYGYVACTTDATGKVVLVYTTPSTIPDSGTVEVNVAELVLACERRRPRLVSLPDGVPVQWRRRSRTAAPWSRASPLATRSRSPVPEAPLSRTTPST